MAGEKVTSQDVAKLAGVSQSAVSRVFTPGASASKRTVEKVRRAAAELGYRPNVLARSLITGRSRIIGLVVAYLENQFYPEAVERLSVALQEKGYHVLVFMAAPTVGDIDGVMQEILDYQVDGIVLASVSMSSSLASQCHSFGIPVVLFNRDQDDDRLSSVTTNNFAGGRALAEHLASIGRSRIAYLAGFEEASTQRDREAGFREGLAAAGQDLFARGVGNFEHAATRDATRRMFDRAEHPDAVFACNDHMAFATMDVLRFELGLSVPGDVAVVGFDDVPLAAWPAYDLTTFRQRVNRMVAETVTTLIDRIEGGERTARRIRIDGMLVERGSTRRKTGE
ncbi:LacI family DNA-binding transcriptional regulator [Amaricoccus sp.]|uniref:LacI family DNA-binding transcriptional regulator n=1 Tax=Amaricoccus sp. TaxID=1872485 RepID=UPI002C4426E9|nr:LacI family DNA-binding transcriptional regulator [Amaricoccus sp.]HRW15134.1 LacI family DNA-binding transcriptional regulator [Amaricoccus sp.]